MFRKGLHQNYLLFFHDICELPLHILKTVFEFVQMGDPNCKLYLVCKKFRNVVYLSRTEMIIHISALTNECGMKLMPDLEKVTISGLCGGQKTSDVQPVIDLFDLNSQKIENLVLKGFCLRKNFFSITGFFVTCKVDGFETCVL